MASWKMSGAMPRRKRLVHAITGGMSPLPDGTPPTATRDTFHDLKAIVERGFRTKSVLLNVYEPPHMGLFEGMPSKLPETQGDSYKVEILAHPTRKTSEEQRSSPRGMHNLRVAAPSQLDRIRIRINSDLQGNARKQRMQYYQNMFPNRRLAFE